MHSGKVSMAQDSATGKTENLFLLSLGSFTEPSVVKDLTGLVFVLLSGGHRWHIPFNMDLFEEASPWHTDQAMLK